MENASLLIVEDNESDAEITIRILKKLNSKYAILHLRDGLEALDYLFATAKYAARKIEDTPDLIVLDLAMPNIDGKSVLKVIRGDDRTKSIPTIIFSATIDEEDKKICNELNVVDFIQKPIDATEYTKMVEKIGATWIKLIG